MGYMFGREQGNLSGIKGQRAGIGGNISSLEGGRGMAGGGHIELWPKRGNILAEVGVAEMVRCRSLYATKRCDRCPLCGTDIIGGL